MEADSPVPRVQPHGAHYPHGNNRRANRRYGMARYIKVTRSDADGSYIETIENVMNAFDTEVIDQADWKEPGDSVTFTVIEMTPEEYAAITEFTGW